MRLAHITDDGVGRTVLRTKMAADAQCRVDGVCQQGLALFCPALVVPYMLQILVIKMVECGKDRVRRCLSESAEGSVLYHLAQSGKCLEVLFGTLAVSYLVQGLQKTLVADTARGTFAA